MRILLALGAIVFLAGCRADSPADSSESTFFDWGKKENKDFIYALYQNTIYFDDVEAIRTKLEKTTDKKIEIVVVGRPSSEKHLSDKDGCLPSGNGYTTRLLQLPGGFYLHKEGGACYIRVNPKGNQDPEKYMWVPSSRIEDVGNPM
jgi:hypothetical protein